MDKFNVLIADGNITCRRLFAQAIERTGYGTTKHIASNGAIAIEWLRQSNIDIVLIDASILENEGMQVLKKMKEENKELEVIITSTSDKRDAAFTLEALELGTIEYMLKPSGESECRNLESMVNHLKSIFVQIKVKKYTLNGYGSTGIQSRDAGRSIIDNTAGSIADRSLSPKRLWKGADLVLIASSAGGPQALETVLYGLPEDFNVPVLVVQHMPPDFTRVLAQTINKRCRLNVFEAFDKAPVNKGNVAIAPGGFHMTVESSYDERKLIRICDTAIVNGVKPSADVLFNSVSDSYRGAKVLVAVLTGMGNDGMSGINEMKRKCDCYCITQSEKTCVVYGMPKNVYEAGLSDEVADIDEIAGRIIRFGSDGG